MDINQIHPELRKATASFPKLPVTSRLGRAITRSLLPLLLPRIKTPAGITISKEKTAGGLDLRIYTPTGSKNRAAMLYIHGGGMILGSIEGEEARAHMRGQPPGR